MCPTYQVLVEYRDPRAGLYRGPMELSEPAYQRYAAECLRICAGGIMRVLLTRSGVVIAQASQ